MRIAPKTFVALVLVLAFTGPALAEPIWDYDVTWTVGSSYLLASGGVGTVSFEGRGPGQIVFTSNGGVTFPNFVTFPTA
jgi:hypothetical protein